MKNSNSKYIFCDFDNTLTLFDTLDFVLQKLYKKYSYNFSSNIYYKLSKIAALEKLALNHLFQTNVLRNGSQEFRSYVKSNDIKLIIVSGNLDSIIRPFAEQLNAFDIIASSCIVDEINMTLQIQLKKYPNYISAYCNHNYINLKNSIYIGDNEYDAILFEYFGYSIAFNAQNPIVKEKANVTLEGGLEVIVEHLKNRDYGI